MSTGLHAALTQADSASRLQAAMTAGSSPDPSYVEPLIDRCRVEPDFYVREMLTWALVRHEAVQVLPVLGTELASTVPQARAQALHTLSKIGEVSTWQWITREHLHDPDDEVARAAWRASAGLTRDAVWANMADERELLQLRDELLVELGRGDLDRKRSLSRAVVELGEIIEEPLGRLTQHSEEAVGAHARATLQLYCDPETSFTLE